MCVASMQAIRLWTFQCLTLHSHTMHRRIWIDAECVWKSGCVLEIERGWNEDPNDIERKQTHFKQKTSIVYTFIGYWAHELKFIPFYMTKKTATKRWWRQQNEWRIHSWACRCCRWTWGILIFPTDSVSLPLIYIEFHYFSCNCFALIHWLLHCVCQNASFSMEANITHKLKNSFHIRIVFQLNCWNQTVKLSN